MALYDSHPGQDSEEKTKDPVSFNMEKHRGQGRKLPAWEQLWSRKWQRTGRREGTLAEAHVEGIAFLPFESFDSRTGFPYINTIPSGFCFSRIMCQQLNEFSVNLEGVFGMVCLEIDAMRCTHISLWGSLELVKELVLCPPKTGTKTPKGWIRRDMPGHVNSNFGNRTFFCTLHFLDEKKKKKKKRETLLFF